MAKAGESIVKEYLESKGLKVLKIPESGIKTVDFAVYSGTEQVFYLEEKTLELVPPAWKELDPVYNAIAKDVYEARKQFASVNSDRLVPNVLSFTNMDPNRDVNYLFAALTGHVITAGGKMRRLNLPGKGRKDPAPIDLYLWFDNDRLSGHIWEETGPGFEEKLKAALDLS